MCECVWEGAREEIERKEKVEKATTGNTRSEWENVEMTLANLGGMFGIKIKDGFHKKQIYISIGANNEINGEGVESEGGEITTIEELE